MEQYVLERKNRYFFIIFFYFISGELAQIPW